MKNKIIELLDNWKVNKHKQELIADELLVLCGVMLSLPDERINEKAEEYADALNLTGLQREACIEDLKASSKWRWLEIEKVLKGNEAYEQV